LRPYRHWSISAGFTPSEEFVDRDVSAKGSKDLARVEAERENEAEAA
jgi:hypothetical protein